MRRGAVPHFRPRQHLELRRPSPSLPRGYVPQPSIFNTPLTPVQSSLQISQTLESTVLMRSSCSPRQPARPRLSTFPTSTSSPSNSATTSYSENSSMGRSKPLPPLSSPISATRRPPPFSRLCPSPSRTFTISQSPARAAPPHCSPSAPSYPLSATSPSFTSHSTFPTPSSARSRAPPGLRSVLCVQAPPRLAPKALLFHDLLRSLTLPGPL